MHALQAARSEVFAYVRNLSGEDPALDPRLSGLLPLLVDLDRRLRRRKAFPKAYGEPERRPHSRYAQGKGVLAAAEGAWLMNLFLPFIAGSWPPFSP